MSWRGGAEQTHDPLLDPRNLERLKAEAQVDSKAGARERGWEYPEYFFSGSKLR